MELTTSGSATFSVTPSTLAVGYAQGFSCFSLSEPVVVTAGSGAQPVGGLTLVCTGATGAVADMPLTLNVTVALNTTASGSPVLTVTDRVTDAGVSYIGTIAPSNMASFTSVVVNRPGTTLLRFTGLKADINALGTAAPGSTPSWRPRGRRSSPSRARTGSLPTCCRPS